MTQPTKIPVQEEKHAGGRPSEYEPQFLHTARDYVEHFADYGDVVPTVEGFADHIGYGTKTVYNWAAEHSEFQGVLDLLKAKQGRLLQNKGLRRETDAGITRLLLSANHGMAEKQEQKTEHSGEIKLSSADRTIAEIDGSLKAA